MSVIDAASDMSDHEMEEKKSSKKQGKVKTKGRGFKTTFDAAGGEDRAARAGTFESIDDDGEEASKSNAQKSVEGWIIFVTNVHEEAQEDDIHDLFADYGEIKQLHLNLDRRTGYVKGYVAIEYEHFKEAQNAIDNLNGHALLEQEIAVDFAFVKGKGGAKPSRRK